MYPTTRDHLPFHLPIPKPLIDLYQLGNEDTRLTQQGALLTTQQLLDSGQVTTDQIDRAAKLVVDTIDGYHLLAQKIWPVAQPPTNDTTTNLHPSITKSDTRQLKRITRLRNTAKRMLPNPNTNTPPTTDPQHTKQTQTQASEVLQLPDPPSLENIPALCNKAIATILNKANRKLVDSLRKKEDQLYKKSPKHYHNNLKTAAGLQHNAKDQPKLEAMRDPTTNDITTHPPQIVDIIQTHFE